MMLLWLDHPDYARHDTGAGHPERPQRHAAVRRGLQALVDATQAVCEEAPMVGLPSLERLHPHAYVEHVREVCAQGPALLDSADTAVSPASWDAALRAAGAALHGAQRALEGTPVFASVRPPGHHAERATAMGFCLFNNAALATVEARARGAERVAVVDFDVHHGNGTQHLFEEDPSVLYVSTHQWPLYPGTGAASETGRGEGEGATLNVPLSAGTDDRVYREALVGRLEPALRNFAPDLLIFSAGFDAHVRDPLGGLRLTSPFFGEITERFLAAAFGPGPRRVLSLLEGGYDLTALEEASRAHARALCP